MRGRWKVVVGDEEMRGGRRVEVSEEGREGLGKK